MYSPDISQHTPALHRLATKRGIPMTQVANRFIEYGLEHSDHILDWTPGQGCRPTAGLLSEGDGELEAMEKEEAAA